MLERRAYARIRLDVPASLLLYQLDFRYDNKIVDLSPDSCYFPVNQALPCGEHCSIQLTAGEGLAVRTVKLAGVIVRTDDKGVGIRFVDLSDEARQVLTSIMTCQEVAPKE
ncbi:MAG: PilZ domain-containing protein [Desulfopila sp.]